MNNQENVHEKIDGFLGISGLTYFPKLLPREKQSEILKEINSSFLIYLIFRGSLMQGAIVSGWTTSRKYARNV